MKHFTLRKTVKSAIAPVRNRLKLWLSHVLPVKPMVGGRELLDVEYAQGAWDYLRDVNELPRFSVVVGYCHHYKPGGRILEIGCGEGLLQERLCPEKYSRYVGVDISTEAIQRASVKQSDRIRFIAADAAAFDPGERFDVVVFNECLEYFDDPISLLRKYESHLAEGGIYIVSMFVGVDTIRNKRTWKLIEPLFAPLAISLVSTIPKFTWTIKVLSTSGRAEGGSPASDASLG